MGSRTFVTASAHEVRAATAAWASFGTAHTNVAICTVTALPGAAVSHGIVNTYSATSTRHCYLRLNGDVGPGTLSLKVGSTVMNPSTNMIPATDGRWYLMGATKAAGTVAVDFFMYDYSTGTWTEFASAGTVANRTAAAIAPCLGAINGGTSITGKIAAGMLLNRALLKAEWRTLINGRWSWYAALGRAAGGSVNRECLIDLTDLGRLYDRAGGENTGNLISAGTQPVVDAGKSPPGW